MTKVDNAHGLTNHYQLTALVCLALMAGCGSGGPKLVPVRGTITYGGGAWPKAGVVYFTPAEPTSALPQRPALGKFDSSGHLTVTSFKEGDGLMPGTYRVGVECWEVPPSMDSRQPFKSYLPAKYQSAATSGLEVVVKLDARVVEVNFDIPKN